jgi:hypothetical protein
MQELDKKETALRDERCSCCGAHVQVPIDTPKLRVYPPAGDYTTLIYHAICGRCRANGWK